MKTEIVYMYDSITISNFYLKIPIQIYADKTLYFHTSNKDPKKVSGGYKTFTRSVKYSNEKIYATLECPIKRKKDFYKTYLF